MFICGCLFVSVITFVRFCYVFEYVLMFVSLCVRASARALYNNFQPIDQFSSKPLIFISQGVCVFRGLCPFVNRGTLMKTGPVRDAQQKKQCVYSIPRDCDRCYIGETSRPLEVCIKEHKTQSLLEKSKLAQHVYEEGHKICWKEAKVLQIEPNVTYIKQGICPHVSDRSSDQSTHLGHISHLDPRYHSRSQITATPAECRLSGKICVFYIGIKQNLALQ
jgi:hypothetical protein